MDCMSLLGFWAVCPDAERRNELPFPCGDVDRTAIPAPLRRRASQAIQLAFSAADGACRRAERSPAELPVVFASVGGEIQVTDVLCVELAKPDGMISPTAFHNAVHNTAAGYWSIAHGVTASATAMAAGRDTLAMALLESWCELEASGGEMLLVCYDESWPNYLAAPLGCGAFAAALVLAAGPAAGSMARLGRPHPARTAPAGTWSRAVAEVPVMAAIPLLTAAGSGTAALAIPLSTDWSIALEPMTQNADQHGKTLP
jgi:hypothetical protein